VDWRVPICVAHFEKKNNDRGRGGKFRWGGYAANEEEEEWDVGQQGDVSEKGKTNKEKRKKNRTISDGCVYKWEGNQKTAQLGQKLWEPEPKGKKMVRKP